MQLVNTAPILVKVVEAHKTALKKAGSKHAYKLALTLSTPKPLELTAEELAVELERVKMALQAFPGEYVALRLGIDLVTVEAQDLATTLQGELAKVQAELEAAQKAAEERLKADAEAVNGSKEELA